MNLKITGNIGDFLSHYEPSELLNGTIDISPENEVTEVRLGGYMRKVIIRPDNSSDNTSFYAWDLKIPKMFCDSTDKQSYINAANDVVTSLKEVIDLDDKEFITIMPELLHYEQYEGFKIRTPIPKTKDNQLLVLINNQGMVCSAIQNWLDMPKYEKFPEPKREIFEGLAYLLIPKPQLKLIVDKLPEIDEETHPEKLIISKVCGAAYKKYCANI